MTTLRLNWKVLVEYVDCTAVFEVRAPDPSVDRLEGGIRGILIWVPNECSACRNIRLVKTVQTSKTGKIGE